ncbi:DNA-methyltransferase [Amycolatopsis australiensis]|uniref:Methyltransferase n=1 Tax=Amycolatopsis australiensis TaxID=546364 RepID=A0A1K1LSX8_9PSEU|nr:site-specific DNA-methyltransferase [Amycolatopsis australiensis]SFW12750.1 site-specific DNA-methyltransferase (cytosine-N4-specific) [Amycolatopsis australiensis]
MDHHPRPDSTPAPGDAVLAPPMPVILRGDARALPLQDASVDLVVTSPPYYALRSYQDGGDHYVGQLGDEPSPRDYLAALLDCTREMVRVLKPTGSIFLALGDKYSGAQGQTQTGVHGRQHRTDTAATWRQTDPRRTGIPNKSLMLLPERFRIAAVDELGLIARAVIIWAKPNGLPESVTDRVRRSHEDWVHLTTQPRYYADLDEIRELYDGDRALSRRVKHFGPGKHVQRAAWHRQHLRGRIPGSVWLVSAQPLTVPASLGVDHYAVFPPQWPSRLVRAWSPLGGVVLDPFGGTATTALTAALNGRTGISVDLSADYGRLARWRATDPRERARAAGTDPAKAAPADPAQPDLFGGLTE